MMKSSLPGLAILERIYVYGLIAILGFIVVHAPLSVFAETQFGHGLIIKAWKELVMGGLLLVAAVIVTKRRAWAGFVRDPIIIASLALAVLYAASLQYGHGFKPYAAGLLIDLRYVLYLVLMYVAVRLFPQSKGLIYKTALIGAFVVVGFGLLQFVLPRDFLSILGYSVNTITPYTTIDSYQGLPRLQSTLRGPNPLGAYALIVAVVAGVTAASSRVARKWRLILLALTIASLVILFASYSRSAYAGVIIGGLIALAVRQGYKRLFSKKVVITGLIVLAVIAAGLFTIRNTTFYTSVIRHEVAGSGPSTNSDEGHSQSLRNGIRDLVAHPFGHGTGSTGSASLLSDDGYIVENQYLYVAHEAGWLGLGLFLFIIGVLIVRAYPLRKDPIACGVLASGIGLLVIGLLLPVFADDTVSIIWFGLAGAVAAGNVKSARAKGARHEKLSTE